MCKLDGILLASEMLPGWIDEVLFLNTAVRRPELLVL